MQLSAVVVERLFGPVRTFFSTLTTVGYKLHNAIPFYVILGLRCEIDPCLAMDEILVWGSPIQELYEDKRRREETQESSRLKRPRKCLNIPRDSRV